MKKTLFIQIDNTPAPIEAENDYIPLNCKQINDFCSFVGDALIGDLKDCNGTPLYRLINPAGRLLSDFEKVDKANYDLIIAQWLDILSEILHKGVSQTDEQFTICFQQQYTNWLLNSENDYFVEIGKSLQANDGKVSLDIEGISEDIISALHMKITRFLNKEKDEIEYIVFSNERIGNSSYIVKHMKVLFDTCSFLRLEQWGLIIQEEMELQRKINDFEDIRAFWLDDLKLGATTKENIPNSDKFNYKGCKLEYNENSRLSKIEAFSSTEIAKINLSNLFEGKKDASSFSYNAISSYLIKYKGFRILEEPKFERSYCDDGYRFTAKLRKETDTFFCDLQFIEYFGLAETKYTCEDWENTLNNITIGLK